MNYNATEIVKFAVLTAKKLGKSVNCEKLNLVVTLAWADYYRATGEYLFVSSIVAGETGPVIPAVNFLYGGFGGNDIIVKNSIDLLSSIKTEDQAALRKLLAPLLEKSTEELRIAADKLVLNGLTATFKPGQEIPFEYIISAIGTSASSGTSANAFGGNGASDAFGSFGNAVLDGQSTADDVSMEDPFASMAAELSQELVDVNATEIPTNTDVVVEPTPAPTFAAPEPTAEPAFVLEPAFESATELMPGPTPAADLDPFAQVTQAAAPVMTEAAVAEAPEVPKVVEAPKASPKAPVPDPLPAAPEKPVVPAPTATAAAVTATAATVAAATATATATAPKTTEVPKVAEAPRAVETSKTTEVPKDDLDASFDAFIDSTGDTATQDDDTPPWVDSTAPVTDDATSADAVRTDAAVSEPDIPEGVLDTPDVSEGTHEDTLDTSEGASESVADNDTSLLEDAMENGIFGAFEDSKHSAEQLDSTESAENAESAVDFAPEDTESLEAQPEAQDYEAQEDERLSTYDSGLVEWGSNANVALEQRRAVLENPNAGITKLGPIKGMGNALKVLKIVPRREIHAYEVSGTAAIIAITSPDVKQITLTAKHSRDLKGVLYCSFYDSRDSRTLNDPKSFITEKTAEKIAKFVIKMSHKAKTLIIESDYGLSRSAGVLAGIYTAFDMNGKELFLSGDYCPDALCYTRVLDAFGIAYDENVVNDLDAYSQEQWLATHKCLPCDIADPAMLESTELEETQPIDEPSIDGSRDLLDMAFGADDTVYDAPNEPDVLSEDGEELVEDDTAN